MAIMSMKWRAMLVQRVVMPATGVESWTVLADDDAPVEPIERYSAYLTDIERSPNTVKEYAHDLKDVWDFSALEEQRNEKSRKRVGWPGGVVNLVRSSVLG
jgi:hypothetical protein